MLICPSSAVTDIERKMRLSAAHQGPARYNSVRGNEGDVDSQLFEENEEN